MKNIFYIIGFTSLRFLCSGQQDSITLSIDQMLQIVKKYHPVVKQAGINIEKRSADITIAKGSFNPIIGTYLSNKTFDNINYYESFNPQISIPTWYGVDISSGIESLTGNRLDPTETQGKTSYIGITVPLLKNLLFDKRRAALLQAKQFANMAKKEQQITINNILKDAATQYWEWVNAYENFAIISKNEALSFRRFEMIKRSYVNGERPAIDTLEAYTQYQGFQFQKNDYWVSFQNEGLAMNAYLWTDNNTAYQLPTQAKPMSNWESVEQVKNTNNDLENLLTYAASNHPELEIFTQKLDILMIDKKLKFQDLLPKLDFKYNYLNKGYNVFQIERQAFQRNYQYELNLSMPLFLSLGRGEYRKAKLKIEETNLEKNQKTLNIMLKIRNYYNEANNYRSQIILQKEMLTNFQRLLKAEETLLSNGESSLFLMNARENKVLESERKLIELKTKYFKSIYALQWSAGLLQ